MAPVGLIGISRQYTIRVVVHCRHQWRSSISKFSCFWILQLFFLSRQYLEVTFRIWVTLDRGHACKNWIDCILTLFEWIRTSRLSLFIRRCYFPNVSYFVLPAMVRYYIVNDLFEIHVYYSTVRFQILIHFVIMARCNCRLLFTHFVEVTLLSMVSFRFRHQKGRAKSLIIVILHGSIYKCVLIFTLSSDYNNRGTFCHFLYI